MQILIRRSGGFAGPLMDRSLKIETSALPEADGRRLVGLLESVSPQALDGRRFRAKSGADLMKYELAFDAGRGPIRLFFDESAVPEEIKPAWEILLRLFEA